MIHLFWEALRDLPGPVRLLECGSLRQPGQPPGMGAEARRHRPDVVLVGLDFRAGPGVDLVADLHDLSSVPEGGFDAVLCCSTLEHVRRPWVVAAQLARVTRPGGVLYCQTHQSFPLHDYPGDYFRFSADALAEVFAPDAGWRPAASGHEYPCRVLPLENVAAWNFLAPAYLNSWILARRL